MSDRERRAHVAEMPFADERRRVAARLEQLRKRDLRSGQPARRIGEEHAPEVVGSVHPVPNRQTPRQQCRPAWRTHRFGHVERRPFLAFEREAIEMRCSDGRVAVRAEIAVPEIIRDDQDDVGRGLRGGRDAAREEAQEGEERSTCREVAMMHGAIMRPRAPEVDVVRGGAVAPDTGSWVPGRESALRPRLRGGGPQLMSQVENRKSEVARRNPDMSAKIAVGMRRMGTAVSLRQGDDG